MKNRLAIGIQSISLKEVDPYIRRIFLFEIEDEIITAIDEDIISLADINYLCLWLMGKKVNKIYCAGIVNDGKELLEKAGIKVYPLDEIRNHPTLCHLLLKETDEKDEQ